MPFLAALWLAILTALSTTPSVGSAATGVDRAAAPVARIAAGPLETARARAGDVADRIGSGPGAGVRRGVPAPLDEALRVARPVVDLAASRGARAAVHGPPAAMCAAAARLSAGAAFARDARARALDTSHAVSARGDVLPYFPTAPPLQG